MTRTLDPAVYWKLRALTSETKLCYQAAVQLQEAFTTAQKKQIALLTELGFDPAVNLHLDDEALTATVLDAPASAPALATG